MSNWLIVPVVALALLAAAAMGAVPGIGGQDQPSADRDTASDRADPSSQRAKRKRFPNPATAGVPAGWEPRQTRTEDLTVTKRGAVIEDLLLVGADISVDAPNVKIRRVKLQGGAINNETGSSCDNGMVVSKTTIEPAPGSNSTPDSEGVINSGGYTARRVEILRRGEGFRVSGGSVGCAPVRIEDSFAKIVGDCARDLHSDGVQGYDGAALTIVNTTLEFANDCGTAPFFVPSGQGNTSAKVKRLLVIGGGYPFRLGVRGKVSGLKIVQGSWVYGPVDVNCSALSDWDASIVKINSDYQIAESVRRQRCTGSGN